MADKLGVSTAAVYERLHDLCEEKARRNADYHDGLFWVRLPHSDFPGVFPYLSSTTVSKALRKLRDEGLVMVGHYDETNGVTNWYATICDSSACRLGNVL